MHKIIIPVDFSETSLNAARYTARMFADKDDCTVIIYHNYETNADLDVSLIFQETLKKELKEAGVKDVKAEHEMGGDLIENIARLAHSIRATLVIMGITGKSSIRQVMFGSNTLKLVDKNVCPVMIIPPDASYKGLDNIGFASDLQNVELSTPYTFINAVIEMFNPKLNIVHISSGSQETLSPEMQKQRNKLEEMFSGYKCEFHFVANQNFFDGLDHFTSTRNIDVLVTVPKHQSNGMNLFKTSHTKRLAYHSHIPILAAHQ